jgi:serine/threonine protein kinase
MGAIRRGMCSDCSCNTVFDLSAVGLEGIGCIRNPAFLASIKVPCHQNIVNPVEYIHTADKSLVMLRNLPGSTYSHIELGRRTYKGVSQYVFIKRPIINGRSLLYEACIQQIVKQSLTRGGFPRGAAAVYDIFRTTDRCVCFSMEVFQDAVPLTVLLPTLTDGAVTQVILELLLQICAMLYHLEHDIGMNHRDLKPSNLMIETRGSPVPMTLRVGLQTVTLQSKYTISLVDFGFSCIGNRATQKADIAIGEVYGSLDPCPKVGRDLYMFLAFLYIDCGARAANDLKACFGKWLNNHSTGILEKIDKMGHEFDPWIYFITGSEQILKFGTSPEAVFGDLVRLRA